MSPGAIRADSHTTTTIAERDGRRDSQVTSLAEAPVFLPELGMQINSAYRAQFVSLCRGNIVSPIAGSISGLRGLRNSITLALLPAVASLLTPLSVVPVTIRNFVNEGWVMTCKNTWALFVLAAVLSLPLTGCKDTKTLQDNEQLKAQVAELQKENGQVGNDLETMTAARDALTQENEKLKAEIKSLKTRSSGKRASSRKHRGS